MKNEGNCTNRFGEASTFRYDAYTVQAEEPMAVTGSMLPKALPFTGRGFFMERASAVAVAVFESVVVIANKV